MAVTSGDPTVLVGSKGPRREEGQARSADSLIRICPFLVSPDLAWRSAHPSRDQRCAAVEPAAPVTPGKQSRLCLAEAHATCLTFEAAVAGALDQSPSGGPGRARAHRRPPGATTRWALVRTAPARLDQGRLLPVAGLTVRGGRAAGVRGAALAVAAVAAFALARVVPAQPSTSPATPGPVAGAVSTLPGGSRSVLVAPVASSGTAPAPDGRRQSPASSGRLAEENAGSPSPAPPTPVRERTYIVRQGDTLYAIALRNGTTVAALQERNGLDSTVIQAGMELRVP